MICGGGAMLMGHPVYRNCEMGRHVSLFWNLKRMLYFKENFQIYTKQPHYAEAKYCGYTASAVVTVMQWTPRQLLNKIHWTIC